MPAIETVNLAKTYQPAKAEPVQALAGVTKRRFQGLRLAGGEAV